MKTVAMRFIAMALFGALACTGFDTVPVGASTPAQWLKFTGVFRLHRSSDGHDYAYPYRITIRGNGTGTGPADTRITWSHVGKHIDFYLFPMDESYFIHFQGIKNHKGFSSRKNPGTLYGETTRPGQTISGFWYAVKIRDEPDA